MHALPISSLVLLVSVSLYLTGPARAQSSAFTYQGQLKNGGVPANGTYNLVFKLFSAASGGSPIGTITRNGVVLTNGLINQTLDFGAGAFPAERRWLEITANAVVLTPRQEITAVPYAMSVPGLFTSEGGVEVSGDIHTPGEVIASAFSSNSPLIFKVNPSNTECARFKDTNCHLGLGTTNPQTRLHVHNSSDSVSHRIETGAGTNAWTRVEFANGNGRWDIGTSRTFNNDVFYMDRPGGLLEFQLSTWGGLGLGIEPQAKLHLFDPVNSVSHRIQSGGGTNSWSRVEFVNGNGQWDIGTSRGFNNDAFYMDRMGTAPLDFQLSTGGYLGLGIEPQAKMHIYDPVNSVSHRVQTGGGTNAWARMEFANGDGMWSVGTSRNFNGNQFYIHREGSPNIAIGIQPNGDAVFGGAIDIGYEIVSAENDAYCPAGKMVLGGGCAIVGDAEINKSYPHANGWHCVQNDVSGFTTVYAYVICARVK